MEQLDINNTLSIMKYGSKAQEKFAGLSDCAFAFLRRTDLEEVGSLLADMLEFFKADAKEGSKNIDKLCKLADDMSMQLKEHHTRMLMDCEVINQFCVANIAYATEITEAINVARASLPKLQNDNGSDVRVRMDALEKRIKDLELTRTVCGNFNNQMKMVENNEATMADKIQSTLVNALAMWKSRLYVEERTNEIIENKNKNLMDDINELLTLQRQGINATQK